MLNSHSCKNCAGKWMPLLKFHFKNWCEIKIDEGCDCDCGVEQTARPGESKKFNDPAVNKEEKAPTPWWLPSLQCMAYVAFYFISDQKLKFVGCTIFCLPLLMDWFLLSWLLVETIISYKKLSHLFLFPGIIYGKIQHLVELSARNWPLKENIRARNFASVYFKVEVKEEGSKLGESLRSHFNLWRQFTNT